MGLKTLPTIILALPINTYLAWGYWRRQNSQSPWSMSFVPPSSNASRVHPTSTTSTMAVEISLSQGQNMMVKADPLSFTSFKDLKTLSLRWRVLPVTIHEQIDSMQKAVPSMELIPLQIACNPCYTHIKLDCILWLSTLSTKLAGKWIKGFRSRTLLDFLKYELTSDRASIATFHKSRVIASRSVWRAFLLALYSSGKFYLSYVWPVTYYPKPRSVGYRYECSRASAE